MFGHNQFNDGFFSEILPRLKGDYEKEIKDKYWMITIDQTWKLILKQLKSTSCLVFEPYLSVKKELKEIQEEFQQYQTKIEKHIETRLLKRSIPETIAHINFKDLRDLNISRNRICNIQALGFLEADLLREIKLVDNQINSIKALNKTKWVNLRNVNLSENYITRLNLAKSETINQLDYFSLDFWNSQFIQIENPIDIIKIKARNINYLILSTAKKVIYKERIKRKIKSRFSTCSLGWGWGRNNNNDDQEQEQEEQQKQEQQQEEQEHE